MISICMYCKKAKSDGDSDWGLVSHATCPEYHAKGLDASLKKYKDDVFREAERLRGMSHG